LIANLAARLKPGAYIHCATDWEPYAVQILEVLSAEPLLQNTAAKDQGAMPSSPTIALSPSLKIVV
jgi:tRNA (guanine-N7-)-methyltransferase